MRGRRQEISALVVALALHAAVFGLLRERTGARHSRPTPQTTQRDDVDFDIDVSDAPRVEAPPESANETQRADGLEPQPGRSVARNSTAHANAMLDPQASTPDLASAEPGATADAPSPVEPSPPAVASAGRPIDLGIGADGWQRWLTAPSSSDTPLAAAPVPRKNRYQFFRAAPASSTGGLQEGLEASDRERGLGPEGRVLSASGKAAHAPEAPETGVARFEVTVHRTGAVEVTLGATAAQRDQWQQVAAHIAEDLRRAPPRIAPPREGLKLVIEVVAEQTLPNGTKVKSLTKPHLAAPLKFQSTDASKEQANRENPTTKNPTADDLALKLDSPGVFVAQNGAICNYSAGVGAIAPGYRLGAAAGPMVQGACDPSNIGAKAQRVVRTRVVAQSVF